MLDFTVLPGNNYDFTKYRSYYVSEAAPLCNIRGFIGSNNPDTLAYARHAKMALATGSYYPACNYGTIFSYFTRRTTSHQRCDEIEKCTWEEFSLLNKTVDEQEITKILRRLDLLDYKDKHPMTLSGGQKQRLALAVATLANKDIMIFDEPTSGLDYGNMIKVCELIKELSSNRIVFVATHDRELMGLLCTRRMEISNESISVYDLATK